MRALLACILLLAAAAPAAAQAPREFQRGFVLTGWSAGTYLTPASDSELWSMAHGGSDHVGVLARWFLASPTASELAPDHVRGPSDDSIRHAARSARALGLNVTLKLQIGIVSGHWIGSAQPADREAFWRGYRAMVLHYAGLASEVGASMLVIGTEMRTLSGDEPRWRQLIADVRGRFHGRLTYAANSDEFQSIRFWDALDFVGVDAYFPLADGDAPAPPAAALAAAWRERGYLDALARTSARTGRRVIFTEIGYRSARAAATRPSEWRVRDTPDAQAQANAYQAFYTAVAPQPWMAGVYWWAVNPDRWSTQDYSPLGKPAEDVMTAFNRAAARP